MKGKKILVIGSRIHSDGYPRNQEIIEALQDLGWDIHWCALGYPQSFHKFSLISRYVFIIIYTPLRWLYAIIFSFFLRISFRSEYVYVAFPSHLDIPIAWFIARLNGAKLIADIFLSTYNTLIQDRKFFPDNSLFAKIIYLFEKQIIKIPDCDFIDTEEHKCMLENLYGDLDGRFKVVPIGINENLFTFNSPIVSNKVIFWGTYIKLHGVETIIEAAACLREIQPKIEFEMIGVGQELVRAKRLAYRLEIKNITFVEEIMPVSELVKRSRSAFCALGIFGVTDKSNSVFPYKAVQALALGIPLITASTLTANRLLTDNENALLVPAGDAPALADAIAALNADPQLGQRLACNGRMVYENNFSRQQIKLALKEIIQ